MRTSESIATVKFLTQDELKRFFKAIERSEKTNPEMLAHLVIFNVMYACGLRASEVGLIRMEQYNPDRGEIFVRRLK